MSKKSIYRITIHNWEKYNKKSKPGHPCVMISKRFLDDAKIQNLCASGKVLFLLLVLYRGETSNEYVEITAETMQKLVGNRGVSIQKLVNQLQSFQLLSYEIVKPLYNIKEVKLKEVKLREEKRKEILPDSSSEFAASQLDLEQSPFKKQKSNPQDNKRVKQAYVDAYVARYGVQPVTQNAKFNSNVAKMVNLIGVEDAIKVVEFYLRHNDGFYLKTTHSFAICLRDCETLRTQMLRKKAITSNDVKNFEKADHFKSQIERIERGEI